MCLRGKCSHCGLMALIQQGKTLRIYLRIEVLKSTVIRIYQKSKDICLVPAPPIAGCTPVAISNGRVTKNNASANISNEANQREY